MITGLNRERRFIFLAILALSVFGLLMVYSASCIYSLNTYGQPGYFLLRQALYLVISLTVFFLILLTDINAIRKFNKEFLIFTVLLLVAVLVIGKKAGGARRWLQIGFLNFQPSELLKISFVLYCSDYFVRKKMIIRRFFEGVLPLLLVTAGISFLIILEPDLGTVIFWLIWISFIFFIIKVRKKHLLFLAIAGTVIFVVLVKTQPYRVSRLLSYCNPWADPRGSGFQIIQSQIGFAEGGIFGVGLGESRQKLLFLPAAHTDFIFSIIAEEFGFIGVLLVLGAYFLILTKMFTVAKIIPDDFARYVCVGIGCLFALEVIINVGVTCGLLPTKGMALPLVSYGGSNLLIHYILFGIFFNITREYENITCLR